LEHEQREFTLTCTTEANLPTLDGYIELPGNICRTKNEHPRIIVTHTVHLHEELGLYTSRGFGFTLSTCSAQRVNFVDEDDRWFLFSRHREKLANESAGKFRT
jgi:hypothetical protein